MSNQIERITFEASFHAGEFSVDGEAVAGYAPLNALPEKHGERSPFYAGEPAREIWVGYEVTDYFTGEIYYAGDERAAEMLADRIAQSHLLGRII